MVHHIAKRVHRVAERITYYSQRNLSASSKNRKENNGNAFDSDPNLKKKLFSLTELGLGNQEVDERLQDNIPYK